MAVEEKAKILLQRIGRSSNVQAFKRCCNGLGAAQTARLSKAAATDWCFLVGFADGFGAVKSG
jgi:hypothetical protein